MVQRLRAGPGLVPYIKKPFYGKLSYGSIRSLELKENVLQQFKAASARAAGNAGLITSIIQLMPNTNDYLNPENTERFKPQAPSPKRQAPSSKHQASSAKPKKYYRKNPGPRSTNQQ